MIDSKYFSELSLTPTQWLNLKIYKFYEFKDTDIRLIPLLLISVFRSSRILKFLMYFEKASYYMALSDIKLFFLFMELFKFNTYSFEQF